MKLRVVEENFVKIDAAIRAEEGRATTGLVEAFDVWKETRGVEALMDELGVPKSARSGTDIIVNGSRKLPYAYGYRASATFVHVSRGTKDWFVTRVDRCDNRYLTRMEVDFGFSDSDLARWATSAVKAEFSYQSRLVS